MDATILLFYAFGIVIILGINIFFIRWLLRINEINNNLNKQTRLLEEIAKKLDVSIITINEIIKPTNND